jgi:L-fucose dehydrogenase
VILDRDADAAHQLQSKLEGEGVTSEVIVVELTELSDVHTAIETVGGKLGRIDGVVNNAGTNDGIGLEHGSPDSDVAFRVDSRTRRLLRVGKPRGRGFHCRL